MLETTVIIDSDVIIGLQYHILKIRCYVNKAVHTASLNKIGLLGFILSIIMRGNGTSEPET
jgi:hypothetical protein